MIRRKEKSVLLFTNHEKNKFDLLTNIASNWKIKDAELMKISFNPITEQEFLNSVPLVDQENNPFLLPELLDADFTQNLKLHSVSEDQNIQKYFYQNLKQIYDRSLKTGKKDRKSNETECVEVLIHLLKSIYNRSQYEVESNISRSIEIGPHVVITENDIEAYKDHQFVLSAEVKDHHNQNITIGQYDRANPQLAANLLSQALLKFKLNNNLQIIHVLGLKCWGYKIIFYKASFTRKYLQSIQNAVQPTESIKIYHYPQRDQDGLSLIKVEERKKIISFLYAFYNNDIECFFSN
jgi:hypothetical protein